MADQLRHKGRFISRKRKLLLERNMQEKQFHSTNKKKKFENDHSYCSSELREYIPIIAQCDADESDNDTYNPSIEMPSVEIQQTMPKSGSKVSQKGWKEGRRIIEWPVLIEQLSSCRRCKLGPLLLSETYIVGEMISGLSGYIYTTCSNTECSHINAVRYGKTHRTKTTNAGMPCFVINTKLGAGIFSFCFHSNCKVS